MSIKTLNDFLKSLSKAAVKATLPVLLLGIVVGGACDGQPQPPSKDLRVSTNFKGGSAEILSLDADAGLVHIQPALVWEQGWPCWWYVRLEGLTKGQEVTLKVSGNPRPFRRQSILGSDWALPTNVAISTDNIHWTQTPPHKEPTGRTAVYNFRAPAESIWLAWGPPFLPSHAEELLDQIAKTPGTERFDLTRTRGGNTVSAIRIGGGTTEKPAKYGVWIQARQHAWEAGSSWVGQGFAEWVASNDRAAIKLRSQATIWYVPIMDIDRVAIGAGGKESVPQDHNRDWTEHPFYPAVAAAQARIIEADQAEKFDLFLDLHNPGASSSQPFFYGPFEFHSISKQGKRNYKEWLQFATDSITDPLPLAKEYFVASYVKDDQEKGSMSSIWVQNHTSSPCVAATLETAWNTPHSTQAGYQAVGRQLGQAVARYIANDPRRKLTD